MPEARTARKKEPPKVCNKCGEVNGPRAKKCQACGSTRFAKDWVRQLRRVNQAFAVQVTDPHPAAARPDPVVTLYKSWPRPKSFNINDAPQWERVKEIIDTELAPYLGWRAKKELEREVAARAKEAKKLDKSLKQLAKGDPTIVTRLVEGLDLKRVGEDDIPQINKVIGDVLDAVVDADDGLRTAIRSLIKKLPQQGKAAIDQLAGLMENLTLRQISAVAAEVQRRMNFLQTFEEAALKETTYELQGDNSIHRLLEQAMWIVDERYWLMQSNVTLRTVVGQELAKKHKKFEKRRPDFVCGTVDNKLIIIELKRPSKILKIEDLNQLEDYVSICNSYRSDGSQFEAFLVGKKADPELKDRLKLRRNDFKVRTYADLIEDAKRRYKGYLDALAAG